jgi:hypothetical protein
LAIQKVRQTYFGISNDSCYLVHSKVSKLEASALRALSTIRFLKNAHSPINGLDPESLSLVFEALVSIGVRCNQSYMWMVVNRVCRYWRNTALSFPSLWSVVDSVSTITSQMCLERSKSSLISVYLQRNCPDNLISAVLSHTSHVYELEMTLKTYGDSKLLSHLIREASPVLRYLSISLYDNLDVARIDVDVPILQSLTLHGISFEQLSMGRVVNLTHLSWSAWGTSSPSMTQLLGLLESNMNLRRVYLNTAKAPSDDGNSNRLVHLDRLESLRIVGNATKVILDHLSLPSSVDIIIGSIRILDGSKGVVEQALPNPLTHLPSVTREFETISVKVDSKYTVSAHRPGDDGTLAISGTSPSYYQLPRSYYSLYPLSIAHVRELWLECVHFRPIDDGLTDGYLQSMFYSLPALNTLSLEGCDLGSIFQMLQPREGHVPCPSLISLTIYDINGNIDCFVLSDLAVMRELQGAPFKKISLLCGAARCELKGLERLRRCVDVVEADSGVEPTFPFRIPTM